MDLPPDKAKLLKNYDDERKWDIICDQASSLKRKLKIEKRKYKYRFHTYF